MPTISTEELFGTQGKKTISNEELFASSAKEQAPADLPQSGMQKFMQSKGVIPTYLREAQPAFKWAVSGMPKDFETIQKVSKQPWADIYRESGGGVLPFAKSTSTAGQMVPQVAGMALDIGTRPSSYAGAYVIPKGMGALATNPVTRRWLQIHTPTLSKALLEANPVEPVYKTIKGIPRDITKPLPKESGKLVKLGESIVKNVNETIDNFRGQYHNLVKPFYKKNLSSNDLSSLPKELVKEMGFKKGATVQQVWEGRWDLLKKLNESSFSKEELLKRTRISEDTLMNGLQRMKAVVMNNVDDSTRQAIERLDPQFGEIISSGKGILRKIYNPTTKEVKTGSLVGMFKKAESEGSRELFNRFAYFDKRINDSVKQIQSFNRIQSMKKWGEYTVGVGALGQFLRWQIRQGMGQQGGGGGRY